MARTPRGSAQLNRCTDYYFPSAHTLARYEKILPLATTRLTISGLSAKVLHVEYRSPCNPPSDVGLRGDIWIKVKPGHYALYFRTSRDVMIGDVWVLWTGLTEKGGPFGEMLGRHPHLPDLHLWVTTSQVVWSTRASIIEDIASRQLELKRPMSAAQFIVEILLDSTNASQTYCNADSSKRIPLICDEDDFGDLEPPKKRLKPSSEIYIEGQSDNSQDNFFEPRNFPLLTMPTLEHPPKPMSHINKELLSCHARESLYGLPTSGSAKKYLVHDIENSHNTYAKCLIEDIKEQLEGVVISKHEKRTPHDPWMLAAKVESILEDRKILTVIRQEMREERSTMIAFFEARSNDLSWSKENLKTTLSTRIAKADKRIDYLQAVNSRLSNLKDHAAVQKREAQAELKDLIIRTNEIERENILLKATNATIVKSDLKSTKQLECLKRTKMRLAKSNLEFEKQLECSKVANEDLIKSNSQLLYQSQCLEKTAASLEARQKLFITSKTLLSNENCELSAMLSEQNCQINSLEITNAELFGSNIEYAKQVNILDVSHKAVQVQLQATQRLLDSAKPDTKRAAASAAEKIQLKKENRELEAKLRSLSRESDLQLAATIEKYQQKCKGLEENVRLFKLQRDALRTHIYNENEEFMENRESFYNLITATVGNRKSQKAVLHQWKLHWQKTTSDGNLSTGKEHHVLQFQLAPELSREGQEIEQRNLEESIGFPLSPRILKSEHEPECDEDPNNLTAIECISPSPNLEALIIENQDMQKKLHYSQEITRNERRLYLSLSESVFQIAQAYTLNRYEMGSKMLSVTAEASVYSKLAVAELQDKIKERQQIGIYPVQRVISAFQGMEQTILTLRRKMNQQNKEVLLR